MPVGITSHTMDVNVVACVHCATDFSAPFMMPSQKSASSTAPSETTPPEDAIDMVTSMGFAREQAIKALKATVSIIIQMFYRKCLRHAYSMLFPSVADLIIIVGTGISLEGAKHNIFRSVQ